MTDQDLARHNHSFYCSDLLWERIQRQARSEGRSANNLITHLLDRSVTEMCGSELREWRAAHRPPSRPLPVAEIPTRCPSCADEVFFHTPRPGEWECGACDRKGTY